ncbi:MAG: hypothetical protein GWN99_08935 [Gemmatimonadetes bacterium]|uniref:Uncharacterized protein n=1 Tax=Candidatus Kutchimonas denitrificans TaxID=3056748 RepID=A0AAE4ZDM5_9BACT|nr:hypothetical protein [Gemmatimonadota bacterium]NIR76690.1 hypothetical protein [Candidatus Kutchimonas denitrificans]NIS01177.1 hypothetical protein [Gemmatimonadota bacterium]NIT68216.1 hypothetical protein [Gemmatimonadota bacterium]NIW75434.1 hypothetical protein [Gemmatimonadota bacterium]
MKTTTQEKIAIGCLTLFLLPFCAVGIGAAVATARYAVVGDWAQAALTLVFALLFGGVGFGMLGVAYYGLRRARAARELQERHPDEPWLWRTDWATGRIESSGRHRMYRAWAFAVFWNLIAFTVPIVVLPEALADGEKLALLILAFPAIGLILLGRAIYLTLRHRKYGVSVLRLATVPGVVGRALRGVILTDSWIRPADGFPVKLLCVNRVVSRSGNRRSVRETVLWEDAQRVTRAHQVGRATAIPVGFRLPADARESDASDSSDQIIWRVETSASVPGVDFGASFDVPVFRTAESEEPLTEEEATALPESEPEFRQPPASRIEVRERPQRAEIYFPAARNLGFAVGITVFFVIWTAVTFILPGLGAPIIFPIVFGLFGLLIGYAVVTAWLLTTHVIAEASGIWIRSGLLGFGGVRHIPADDIDDITLDIGSRAGNRSYYDIKIQRANGKRVYAGRAIPDRREAEWLIERMRNGLGLEGER